MPAPTAVPETVACRDGTSSKIRGKGACSHHGGVKTATAAVTSAAAPAVATATPATPAATTAAGKPTADDSGTVTARCKDGTTAHSRIRVGTCSDHGGVAQWLATK